MRRYKYLEKMFEEEMKKVLVFIKGFTPIERVKLARMTALWLCMYLIIFTIFTNYAEVKHKRIYIFEFTNSYCFVQYFAFFFTIFEI